MVEQRLIDANALLEIYKKWIPQLASPEDDGDRRGVETCILVLKDTPTVDAVEVVRCRECKYLMFSDCYGECSKGRMGIVSPDDFCSYGERKEGAD